MSKITLITPLGISIQFQSDSISSVWYYYTSFLAFYTFFPIFIRTINREVAGFIFERDALDSFFESFINNWNTENAILFPCLVAIAPSFRCGHCFSTNWVAIVFRETENALKISVYWREINYYESNSKILLIFHGRAILKFDILSINFILNKLKVNFGILFYLPEYLTDNSDISYADWYFSSILKTLELPKRSKWFINYHKSQFSFIHIFRNFIYL